MHWCFFHDHEDQKRVGLAQYDRHALYNYNPVKQDLLIVTKMIEKRFSFASKGSNDGMRNNENKMAKARDGHEEHDHLTFGVHVQRGLL